MAQVSIFPLALEDLYVNLKNTIGEIAISRTTQQVTRTTYSKGTSKSVVEDIVEYTGVLYNSEIIHENNVVYELREIFVYRVDKPGFRIRDKVTLEGSDRTWTIVDVDNYTSDSVSRIQIKDPASDQQ